MARPVDLDHNATTRLDPRARAAMVDALDDAVGNPSSLHSAGRRARELVERARDAVAALVGAAPRELLFTSCGSESVAAAILGGARAARAAGRPARVVSSPLEHPAALGALEQLRAEGFEIVLVAPDSDGALPVERVAAALAPGAALASFAVVNHELGNRYPVGEFARVARAVGAAFHTDAVQAAGRIAVDARALGVDLLSLSAHKLHGPKGIGALVVRAGVAFAPLIPGHQERGLRGGTENLAGAVGFGVAASIVGTEGLAAGERVGALTLRLEAGLCAAGARLHGAREGRAPGTVNVGFDGVPGDLLVAALDLEGILASTGAACASGTTRPSSVLLALGASRAQAECALRLSLGRDSVEDDIDRALEAIPRLVARIRAAC